MSFHSGIWQKNADAAVKYFEELTTECVSGREAGSWVPGAIALGLEGPVSLADFKALAYGKDPKTGRNITARQKSNCQAAFEVVAACPKSYSIAAVLGKDERRAAILILFRSPRHVKNRAGNVIHKDESRIRIESQLLCSVRELVSQVFPRFLQRRIFRPHRDAIANYLAAALQCLLRVPLTSGWR